MHNKYWASHFPKTNTMYMRGHTDPDIILVGSINAPTSYFLNCSLLLLRICMHDDRGGNNMWSSLTTCEVSSFTFTKDVVLKRRFPVLFYKYIYLSYLNPPHFK